MNGSGSDPYASEHQPKWHSFVFLLVFFLPFLIRTRPFALFLWSVRFFFDFMVWACLHVCLFWFTLFVSLIVKGGVCECVGGMDDDAAEQSPDWRTTKCVPALAQPIISQGHYALSAKATSLVCFQEQALSVGANQTASSTRATSRLCPSFLSRQGGREGVLAHVVDE